MVFLKLLKQVSIVASFAALLLASLVCFANGARLNLANEVLAAQVGATKTSPLYISRRGSYFAELYLEREASVAGDRSSTVDIALTVSFRRNGKALLERDVAVQFAPGEVVANLFQVDSPFDLPHRKAMDLSIAIHDVRSDRPEDIDSIRLQLTRKPQFLKMSRF